MGWLLVLALVAFATSTAFKLVPHYLDYMTMKKIIEAVDTNKTPRHHHGRRFLRLCR